MFSKFQKKRRPKKNYSHLVAMIEDLVQKTGLLSYSALHRVHWFANPATFCFLIAYILQIIALFTAHGDPERLFECFTVLSFCGMGVLKLNSLRRKHKIWSFLLTQISTLENEQLNLINIYQCGEENINFPNCICNYTKKFKRTSIILTRIYSFTAVVFILSPFVELIWKLRGTDPVGYPHILPTWTPLDALSIYGYAIAVVCELLAAVYCVCVHVAFDLTSFGLMIFVCGQFAVLRTCSERIGGSAEVRRLSDKVDEQAHFRIKHCHRTHLILITSIRELDKLLKNILGVYFLLATMTLCTVAVRISSESMSLMQLMTLLQYLGATLTQLFLFCRYGDAVMNESSIGMGQGPFAAAVWSLSPRIRRELVILGVGMMRPRRLHAGPFNSLDLPSFIQVIRTAYSYYAVLGSKK